MKRLLSCSAAIDRLTETIGRAASWLTLALVLIGAFNAVARYLGRFTGISLSSNALLELQWYVFTVLFLLGGAYGLRHNAHVRVDILFERLSPRVKMMINCAGHILFLIPFAVLVLVVSWTPVAESWRIAEASPDPGGLPRYPLKTLVPVAFLLLIAQAISEIIKEIAGREILEPRPHAE